MVVYNILPTIAYRQNYIGINTNDPTKNGEKTLLDPALTVSAYNQQKNIYLVSSDNIARINLSTGEQFGFIINCGSWGDTPSEPIPGGGSGDIPAGLAQVAYSGHLADLENDRNRIVVFVGGDSGIKDNSST
jgi:hypothetical protein